MLFLSVFNPTLIHTVLVLYTKVGVDTGTVPSNTAIYQGLICTVQSMTLNLICLADIVWILHASPFSILPCVRGTCLVHKQR